MLSVMKRKLQQEEETKPEGLVVGLSWVSRSSTDAAPADSSPEAESRIVSHVPVSTRGSVSSISSTGSSISSAQFHPFQSLSRRGEDETHDGEPPQLKPKVIARVDEIPGNESSSVTSQVVLKPSSKTVSEPSPKESGFKRTISFVSGDFKDSVSQQSKRVCHAKPAAASPAESVPAPTQGQRMLLLGTAKDGAVLSPLHIFVRQQIEVFEASEDDLRQPAPGRRIPIQLKQVGLRCIHCKHQKARERKKRAVCYPSSVGRVYHSVSDMKFAHFPCSQMPPGLQKKFSELKDESQLQSKLNKESGSKRIGSTSASTAQYYHDSARELGMEDRKGGIYASPSLSLGGIPTAVSAVATASGRPPLQTLRPHPDHSLALAAISQVNALHGILLGNFLPSFAFANTAVAGQSTAVADAATGVIKNVLPQASAVTTSAASSTAVSAKQNKAMSLAVVAAPQEKDKGQAAPPQQVKGGNTILASEMDKHYLAPIHCFVRRHVEVFAANEKDLAAPAPGRKKPIVLGQVGLRCIHCARLPVRERVKRAICFPPSVSGVYHAVSNMKFDHFKHCKGMPKEAREEFQELSSSPSSGTGGKRSSSDSTPRPRVSNSTAQYYHDSALRMGLRDTSDGIRFLRVMRPHPGTNPSAPVDAKNDGEVPGGMEALIIAATDPVVRAAHEQRQSQPTATSA